MNENNHFIPHRKFCIYSKENVNQNEKINPDIFYTNIRCPLCNQICLIKLDKENYNFDIKCAHCSDKISENDAYINNYYKLRNKLTNNDYYNKSDFYCNKHTDFLYHSFCKKCNLNICEKCLNRHYNHEKIELNSIMPEQNDIFLSKIKIRKKKDFNEKVIENIIKIKNDIDKEINNLIAMINNIFSLEEYIIKNYNNNNPNKNYYYIENIKTIINNLDINFSLSDEFINDSNFETKSKALMKAIIKLKKNKNNSYKENNNNEFKNTKILLNNNNINYDNIKNNSKKGIKKGKSFNFIKINKKNNSMNNSINRLKQKEKLKREKNVLNISLDDTMQKNEQLEGNKKIGNEFIKYIKIPEKENEENKYLNKDNNRQSSSLNNNFNIYYNSVNNNLKESKISYYESFKEEKEKGQINPQIKFSKNFDNVIKSIEFIDKDNILICDTLSLNIYSINSNSNDLKLIYSIKQSEEGNYNYSTKLNDGNIIICSTYDLIIIKLEKEKSNSKIINHNIIQKISNKFNNLNKIIEIPHKQSIITCDKENIKKFKKDSDYNYIQVNITKIDTEIKCIEYINDDVFVAVMPENDEIIFYDIDSIHNNKCVYGKIYGIYGRYVIKNSEKFKCVFFASTIGLYIFSNVNYKLISIYKLDDWISSMCLDYENDYLICSGINKNDINKNISLIIFSITKNEFEEVPKNKIKLLISNRIDNICKEDIIAMNCLEKQILLGRNDKKLQLYNY